MKIPSLFCLGFSLLAGFGPLSAAVLLEVDISTPSAVVVRFTGGLSSTSSTNIDNFHGILLKGITAEPTAASGAITAASLTATGGNNPFDEWWLPAGGNVFDLNLYFNNKGAATFQVFVENSPAFTGTATLNMQDVVLPAIGHSGNIFVGDDSVIGPVIGSYVVVPEPTSGALLLLAVGLLLTRRR